MKGKEKKGIGKERHNAWCHATNHVVDCMVQQWNAGLSPANFLCPAFYLQLMGDHLCG